MHLERLISFFANSPSARLLRSPHAAHIVFFLFENFKTSGAVTIPHGALRQRLAEFQKATRQNHKEILTDRADTLLTKWSTGESRWLRRFHDATGTHPVYELTPQSEDVLTFLSTVLERNPGFIGTESRLKRVVDTLAEIAVQGSDDPVRRLEHLRQRREHIDREIAAIESGDEVATFGPTAIRERFVDAVSELSRLQGDFRAVEETFRGITRDVQKRQAETGDTRGDILKFALDAEEALKSQDQGVSFDEFVRFILSPINQDELESIVKRLQELDALADQADGMRRVRGMMSSLADEAEKVLSTTRRLSATLRRLLDARSSSSRQQLADVLRDIRGLAARLSEQSADNLPGIEVSTQLELQNVGERSFWTSPEQFAEPELSNHEPSDDDRMLAFRQQAGMQRLDWTVLRGNITSLLQDGIEELPLSQLLEACPPSGGAVEILGYIQLAHDGGHVVDETETEFIELQPDFDAEPNDETVIWEVPRVTFLSDRLKTGGGHASLRRKPR